MYDDFQIYMKLNIGDEMKAKLLGNKYQVFINKKLIVSGKFISRWAAFLAVVDVYGMDRIARYVLVRHVK